MVTEYVIYGADSFNEHIIRIGNLAQLFVSVYKRGASTTYVDSEVLSKLENIAVYQDKLLMHVLVVLSGSSTSARFLTAMRVPYINFTSGSKPVFYVQYGAYYFTIEITPDKKFVMNVRYTSWSLREQLAVVDYDFTTKWFIIGLAGTKLYLLSDSLDVLWSYDLSSYVSDYVWRIVSVIGYKGSDGSEFGAECDWVYVSAHATE